MLARAPGPGPTAALLCSCGFSCGFFAAIGPLASWAKPAAAQDAAAAAQNAFAGAADDSPPCTRRPTSVGAARSQSSILVARPMCRIFDLVVQPST